uniref:uncharacterized protein LOC122591951 n=1 Tax=Erigeron canadensis TaxID=72917 RepID=UPI001CB98902|nr:uncharacterized protein LOC122591951 [Erigeron canadensis]
MISRFKSVGARLGDEELIRKLFNSIAQFVYMEKMPFEEAIGRLEAFEDRLRNRQKDADGDNEGQGDQVQILTEEVVAEVGLEAEAEVAMGGRIRLMMQTLLKGMKRKCSCCYLLTEREEEAQTMVLLNEKRLFPKKYEGMKDLFAELDESITGKVRFGDGSKSYIISLGQMTEEGYDIWMHNEFLRMYDRENDHEDAEVVEQDGTRQLPYVTKKGLVTQMPGILHTTQVCEGTKVEALTKFKTFTAEIENKTTFMVKMLRTDRGSEFNSNEFIGFYKHDGIKRKTTPYTPQQNSVVERRNLSSPGYD